jgi:hypothetical protein
MRRQKMVSRQKQTAALRAENGKARGHTSAFRIRQAEQVVDRPIRQCSLEPIAEIEDPSTDRRRRKLETEA